MKSHNEVIITTYNNPKALDRVLDSINSQSTVDFLICVADDGSTQDTNLILKKWQTIFGSRMRHLWHEDKGFRKNLILNTAIKTSSADYLIFLDGDCIAKPDFVETHIRRAGKDRYLTGGVIRLSAAITEKLLIDRPSNTELFSTYWLHSNGLMNTISNRLKSGMMPRFLERRQLLDTSYQPAQGQRFRERSYLWCGRCRTRRQTEQCRHKGGVSQIQRMRPASRTFQRLH
jgi:glycosyltransferase involved in cell wall biosynthesis